MGFDLRGRVWRCVGKSWLFFSLVAKDRIDWKKQSENFVESPPFFLTVYPALQREGRERV